MTHADRVLLGPLEKLRRHGRVPFKLILHALLALSCASAVFLQSFFDASYLQSMNRSFRYFFAPEASVRKASFEFFSIADAVGAVEQSVTNFYAVAGTSIMDVSYVERSTGSCQNKLNFTAIGGPRLTIAYRNDRRSESCDFSPAFVGGAVLDACAPLQEANVRDTFDSLQSMALNMQLCNTVRRLSTESPAARKCFRWSVTERFAFSSTGVLRASVDDRIDGPCTSQDLAAFISDGFNWVLFLVVALCALHLLLLLTAAAKALQTFFRLRAAHARCRLAVPEGRRPAALARRWNELPWAVRRRFLRPWLYVAMAGDALVMYSALQYISNRYEYTPTTVSLKLTLGTGSFLVLATLTRYLKGQRRVFAFALTLAQAVPRLASIALGCAPLFFGFVLFGTLAFGTRVELFGSLMATTVTLFCLMNGDSVHDVFAALQGYFPVLGALYLYTYISLFIYVCLNVVTAVVEEAYFASLRFRRELERYSGGRKAAHAGGDALRGDGRAHRHAVPGEGTRQAVTGGAHAEAAFRTLCDFVDEAAERRAGAVQGVA